MPTFPLLHRIWRGDWVDHIITVAQIAVVLFAIIGIAGWLSLNPFLLLTFIFAQPLVALGVALFIFAALFFERAFTFETFDPGEIIFRQDSPARSIYLVRSGTIGASIRRGNGEEVSVITVGSGEYIGFAALARDRYRLTARAVTAAEVIRIRPRDFVTIFAEIPEVRQQFPILRQKVLDAIDRHAPELRKDVEKFIVQPDLVRTIWRRP